MNDRDEFSDLLADVLSAGAAERERLFELTVRCARRRRRLRRVRQVSGAAVALVLGVLIATRANRGARSPTPAAYVLVHTATLPGEAIIGTVRKPRVAQVETQAFAATFHTVQGIPRLTDEQLLAFAGNRAVALIRTAPHQQRLYFPDGTPGPGSPE